MAEKGIYCVLSTNNFKRVVYYFQSTKRRMDHVTTLKNRRWPPVQALEVPSGRFPFRVRVTNAHPVGITPRYLGTSTWTTPAQTTIDTGLQI